MYVAVSGYGVRWVSIYRQRSLSSPISGHRQKKRETRTGFPACKSGYKTKLFSIKPLLQLSMVPKVQLNPPVRPELDELELLELDELLPPETVPKSI